MLQDDESDQGFATGLASLCLRMLGSLYLQEHDKLQDREQAFDLREELHTLYLWKEPFEGGRLDTALDYSEDLRDNVLDCLSEIGRIILRSKTRQPFSNVTPNNAKLDE